MAKANFSRARHGHIFAESVGLSMSKRERDPIARNEVTEIDTAAAEKDFGAISDAQNELLDLDQDLTLGIREYERLRAKVRKLMVEFGLLDGSNGR